MKTTVHIPDELYGQVRKLADARGKQVAALITEGLQKLVRAHLAPLRAKAAKNGHAQTSLPPKAAQWLSEWRALSQQHATRRRSKVSAAEALSLMRR